MMREMKILPDIQVIPENTRELSFTVKDYVTGEPIRGAKVKEVESDIEKTTGSAGGCKVTVSTSYYPVFVISAEGYENDTVEVGDENSYTVRLSPST